MEAVVTSAYIEALTAPTSAEAVVSSAYIEALTAPTSAEAVVSSIYMEVLTVLDHRRPTCRAQIIG